MAYREVAHTEVDRWVTPSNDVTLGKMSMANAGSSMVVGGRSSGAEPGRFGD